VRTIGRSRNTVRIFGRYATARTIAVAVIAAIFAGGVIMPPLLEANPIVAHVESCVVLANLSSGFSKGTPRPATDTTQRRRSSADSTLGKGQPARLSFRRLFRRGLYEYTSQLIYLTRKIQRHCVQDFHGVTPMTFVFQLRNAFVEGAQFALQFLNFMLNGKPPNRIFLTGWLFLWTRCS
jgi:hypothetical protein